MSHIRDRYNSASYNPQHLANRLPATRLSRSYLLPGKNTPAHLNMQKRSRRESICQGSDLTWVCRGCLTAGRRDIPLELWEAYLGDPTVVLINAEDPGLLSARMASATWADCTWMFKSEVHKYQDRSQSGVGPLYPYFYLRTPECFC